MLRYVRRLHPRRLHHHRVYMHSHRADVLQMSKELAHDDDGMLLRDKLSIDRGVQMSVNPQKMFRFLPCAAGSASHTRCIFLMESPRHAILTAPYLKLSSVAKPGDTNAPDPCKAQSCQDNLSSCHRPCALYCAEHPLKTPLDDISVVVKRAHMRSLTGVHDRVLQHVLRRLAAAQCAYEQAATHERSPRWLL